MEHLIYIDCCMRQDSRTRRIAEPIMEELSHKYEVTRICLEGTAYPAVNSKILDERASGYVPEEYVETARKIAFADRIVIAAPFWDMSFPGILKLFIENMSLFGITFSSNEKECYGLCKCKKLLYITSRGMNIRTGEPLEQATPYLKAISFLWGLGEVITVAAENMDYSSPEVIEEKIAAAVRQGFEICREF